MSDSKNGKNGSEKEIDRLLSIVQALARVDTKVSVLDEQLKSDITELKEEIKVCSERLACIETSGARPLQIRIEDLSKKLDDACNRLIALENLRAEIIKSTGDNALAIVKLQSQYDKTKWIWAAIAGIGTPAITTLIVLLVEYFSHLI